MIATNLRTTRALHAVDYCCRPHARARALHNRAEPLGPSRF